MTARRSIAFTEQFNLVTRDIKELLVKENSAKTNCFLFDTSGNTYNGIIIIDKPSVKTICKVTFFPSSTTGKYLPRLEFRKTKSDGSNKIAGGSDIIIAFGDNEAANKFWEVINFLKGFEELVDLGEFKSNYQSVTFDGYLKNFIEKNKKEKLSEVSSLLEKVNLDKNEIKILLQTQRRNAIHWFYAFLKDLSNNQGVKAFDSYRTKHEITQRGDEAIWHHFLKTNDWIIGLNVDLKFIRDFDSEQRLGNPDSKNIGSPKTDLIGVSYFTTLLELKTSKTEVFKEKKGVNSRANTWDFTDQFIEAYSQVLGQRTLLDSNKKFIGEDGFTRDNEVNRILDPKAILIIGNRNKEFPHVHNPKLDIRSDTFERFRRDSRNIEIITFDELFERAFHITYIDKLPQNWNEIEPLEFKNNILLVK